MRNHFRPSRSGTAAALAAARATLLAVAGCAALQAQHEQEKERKPERPPRTAVPAQEGKPEAKPAPRHEPKPESRPEPRPEARPEPRPRREPVPESRPDHRQEGRQEPVPEPRRTTRPDPKPDNRRETPMQAPQPRPEPSGSARRDPGIVPRPAQPQRPGPGPVRAEPSRGEPRPTVSAQVVKIRGGGEIHRTNSGIIREVRTPAGVIIRHSPSGARHVEAIRPGGRVIVANATGRRGYLQRPLVIRNYTFVQRTYILNGVPQARIYRPWAHDGRIFHIYTPVRYYRPAFYSYVYTPWPRPIHYGWGWETRPWYGYYGGYFTPYRTYTSPAFWLADFLIATTLEAAFLAQRAAVVEPPVVYTPTTSLSPEVKQAIAEEVHRQMEREREAQVLGRDDMQPDTEPALFTDRGPRVFMVANSVLAYSGGQDCPLMEGDVLQLLGTPSVSAEMADVRVLASRGGSCRKGSVISVRLTDLQEMQNHLRATLDQGMTTLQADQGRNGLPSLPSHLAGTVATSYADEVRPDADAADQISQVVQDANRSEQEMIDQGPQDQGGASITLGMTLTDVERAMGRPKNTVDLGSKKIYVYKDLKITFLNGRVSDVQ